MSILLFGATGQLGKRLSQHLSQRQIPLVPISRATCDFASASAAQIDTLIAHHKPQCVINEAAYARVDDAEKERALVTRINAEVPGLIAAACAKHQAQLIHYSTDYVFDGERAAPYGEDDTTNPINHYGASKRAGELAVLRAHPNAYVIRLQLLYDATGNSFFQRIAARMQQDSLLKVAADQIASPTPVTDVVNATLHFYERLMKNPPASGIYHMVSAGFTSRHGFACAIREALKDAKKPCMTEQTAPIVSEEFPSPAPRPKDLRLKSDKLTALGIQLPHWRDGLKRVMEEHDAAA